MRLRFHKNVYFNNCCCGGGDYCYLMLFFSLIMLQIGTKAYVGLFRIMAAYKARS